MDKIKEEWENTKPLVALGIGATILYAGATIALNSLCYSAQALVEVAERGFGAQTTNLVAKLDNKSQRELLMPGIHGRITESTFETPEGKRITALDGPVVTEGKFLPRMGAVKSGKNYVVTLFGSEKIGYNFVEASPIN